MHAKIEGGYNHVRQQLAEVVPCEAPFTLFISPTQRCNFRCFYCTHSMTAQEKKDMGFRQIDLDLATVYSLAEQAKKFNGKIKRVVFTGLGEPLVNPQLPEMIRILSAENVAQSYEIITNAYLLTPQMTDALLDAGLTYLRVSIQGMTSEKYQEIAGVKMDYQRLLDNLKYFYSKKGNCKVYIKIMDSCLDNPEDRDLFYHTYESMCDKMYVEHLVKAQPGMMDKYGKNVTSEQTFFGETAEYREVCPYIFYVMQVDCNGDVFPCPPLGFPPSFAVGNIYKESLWDIWNGKKLYELQTQHLRGARNENSVCRECENYLCFTPAEDNLDEKKNDILRKVEEKGYV